MRIAARLRNCAAAFVVVLGTEPALGAHVTDITLDKLDSWAEAIAVCDVTRFLLTDPDVEADAIIVTGRDNSHTVLYQPLYAPPTNFFSDAMRDAFENVRKAGLVTPEAYSKARIRYAGILISAYRSATLADKRYLADQMDLCYHLAARTGVKLETKR